jgi:hypothetical protein
MRERAERTKVRKTRIRSRRVRAHALGGLGASFGPARGRLDDGSAEACRSGCAGVSAASEWIAAHGILCAPEAIPELVAPGRDVSGPVGVDRGRPPQASNGEPVRVHNVTPREDYRTALPFDSPDTGCSLSHRGGGGQRTDPPVPRPRYSAGAGLDERFSF